MWQTQSIARREGIRQLPGICWYPAERTGTPREVRVAPRIDFIYSSLTEASKSLSVFLWSQCKTLCALREKDISFT